MYNHNQHECLFSEQIVLFLYDELSVQDKSVFTSHLTNCPTCNDELAGFGFVHNSFVEWKNIEFSNLKTPIVEIPYLPTNSTEKKSRLSELKDLFSLKPSWATAFAGLLICFGLTLLAFNFSLNSDNAKVIESSSNQTILPKTKEIVENNDVPINEIAEVSKKSEIKLSSPQNNMVSVPKTPIIKINKARNLKETKQNTIIVAKESQTKQEDKSVARQVPKIPKLTDLDEEVDNSLRLSDLLADVESK